MAGAPPGLFLQVTSTKALLSLFPQDKQLHFLLAGFEPRQRNPLEALRILTTTNQQEKNILRAFTAE